MSDEKEVKKSKSKKDTAKEKAEKKEPIEVEGEVVEEKKAESVKDKVKEAGKKLDIDTDDIKNETVDTYNQVKDTFKNVDIKKDAEEAKSFVTEVFTDPFAAIKDAASEKKNVFNKAIIMIVLWVAIGFIAQFISNIHYHFYLGELFHSLLNPVWYVIVISGVVYIFNKENKKSMTTIISTIVTASVPRMFDSVVALLNSVVSRIDVVTNPVSYTLRVVTIVLTYFAVKELLGVKENEGFLRKFIIMVVLIEFIFKLLSLIGIGSIVL